MVAVRMLFVAFSLVALVGCNTGPGTAADPDEASEPSVGASEVESDAAAGTASEPDADALARVTEAAEATAEAGTVHVVATVETEGTGGEDGVQPISAEGDEDFVAQQRQLTLSGPTGELQVVVDGTDVYVEIPGTEDESWARVELTELLETDIGFGGPGGLPFASSEENLSVLSDAVASATEAGEEDLDGETATRYDLVVDLTAAADESTDDTGLLRATAEQSGITELAMQVWIGDDERIRRVSYELDLSQADVDVSVEGEAGSESTEVAAEPAGIVSVTVDYSDFGEDVTIELPPDDAVIDLDEDEIRSTFGQ